jgi:hypothetical protein
MLKPVIEDKEVYSQILDCPGTSSEAICIANHCCNAQQILG